MTNRAIEFSIYKYGVRFYWIEKDTMKIIFAFNIGFSYPDYVFRKKRDFNFKIWLYRNYLPHSDTSWGFVIKNIF